MIAFTPLSSVEREILKLWMEDACVAGVGPDGPVAKILDREGLLGTNGSRAARTERLGRFLQALAEKLVPGTCSRPCEIPPASVAVTRLAGTCSYPWHVNRGVGPFPSDWVGDRPRCNMTAEELSP